ncbi:cytochrome P450 2K6-like isoform X1 [Ranitomeya imitator]|uniref:cytochrome P450 2K6-like isoform X1 n=1 Tax=Ranitomeya imitator TaxID=111125 RepID=UPI0037E8AAFD
MAFIAYFLARADVLVYFSIFIALFIYWINGIRKSTAKMPPGPMPLPVIGNLHMVDLNRPHESLMQLSEKYGEVFTLHFGPKKMVILAGYKIIKEALVTRAEDFGERAITPVFDIISNGHGKPFNPHMLINTAVSNVICSIIFGKRFEYDDPEFEKLIHMLDENVKLMGTPKVMLYDYYPFLGSLLGLHKKLMQNIQDLRSFISKWSMNRRLDFNANNITGYIDAYLLKQEQEATKAQTYFNEENLLASVLDLFSAGTETTSTTIQWGILLMMKYPEIQKKVQEEIKTHIKPGQLPTVEDRKKMPYTDAVIHEIQRFGNILPLNGSHSTPTDVYLRGYLIPKGIEVIPFLTSVLYDKTQWKTPYDFNPNHFLDENGKFVRPDAFMPFSVGRRACAGESLAKMELFLFFTGLLQAFTFYPPPGVSREDLSLKPGVGLTLVPTPYMTCAKPNY